MTFVILAGQIDLSVGSVVALVSVSTGLLMVDAGLNPVLALPLAILAGALVGLFNGSVFAFTRIPSFVVTLGSMAMASGLALGLTTGSTISGFPSAFLFLGQGVWLGIPVPVWLAAVVALVAHLVLTKTVFGRHVFLIGSNAEAAVLSGVRVRAVKISIFVISSSLAAFASVIETARLSVGRPDAGSGYELVAIGAVVIGGASLFGGEGSILGTVLGTTLLGLILNGLIMLSISAYWQEMFSGAIIILAVALNMRRRGGRAGGRGWAGVRPDPEEAVRVGSTRFAPLSRQIKWLSPARRRPCGIPPGIHCERGLPTKNSGSERERALAGVRAQQADREGATELLQMKGLVRIVAGRGTFVSPITGWSLLDPCCSSRVPSSRRTARRGRAGSSRPDGWSRSVRRGSPPAPDRRGPGRAGAARHDHGGGSGTGNVVLFVDADIQFHRVILEATGNSFIVALFNPLEEVLRLTRYQTSAHSDVRKHAMVHHEKSCALSRRATRPVPPTPWVATSPRPSRTSCNSSPTRSSHCSTSVRTRSTRVNRPVAVSPVHSRDR